MEVFTLEEWEENFDDLLESRKRRAYWYCQRGWYSSGNDARR